MKFTLSFRDGTTFNHNFNSGILSNFFPKRKVCYDLDICHNVKANYFESVFDYIKKNIMLKGQYTA